MPEQMTMVHVAYTGVGIVLEMHDEPELPCPIEDLVLDNEGNIVDAIVSRRASMSLS
jgi:hypothetical protein